jgi:NADP-dependent 3-hydroxy acid dehydrogenase YdfG
MALVLAGKGAALAAFDLPADHLVKLAVDLASKPIAWVVADVTNRPSLVQAVLNLEDRRGPIDRLLAGLSVGWETFMHDFLAEAV